MYKKTKKYNIYYIIRCIKNVINKKIAVNKFDINEGKNSAIERICYTYCVSESFELRYQLFSFTKHFNKLVEYLGVLKMNSLHSVGAVSEQFSFLGV